MTKILIVDTADAVVTRKRDGHKFISAETQLASLVSSLGVDEKIFGGIGNKPLAKFQGQKEVSTSLRNAFFDTEMLAMTQGVEVEESTALVHEKEEGLVVKDGKVTIVGTPIGKVQVRNTAGELLETDVTEGEIDVPEDHADEGSYVQVWYKKEVTGETVEYKADKFAEAHEVEYHTIGYDPDTNEVVQDVYIQLDHVLPSGEVDLSFENGTAQAPEISLEAMTNPNTNNIGRVIVVPRKKGSSTPTPPTP